MVHSDLVMGCMIVIIYSFSGLVMQQCEFYWMDLRTIAVKVYFAPIVLL